MAFHWLVILHLALLGALIYRNAFGVPFIFDDIYTVVNNPAIRDLSSLRGLWVYDPSRFLTHLSFALNFHFGELNVRGYHAVNIVLHALNAMLLYALLVVTWGRASLRQSLGALPGRWLAFGAAVLFLCHPIQTQAVTYISQRSTLMASFCYLLTILLYFLGSDLRRWRYYAAAILVFFAGLFTKPIIISLPFALLLWEIFFLRWKGGRVLAARLVPFLILACGVPLLLMLWKYRILDVAYLSQVTRETEDYSRAEYLFTQFNVLILYIRLLFFPSGQQLDYDFPISRGFWDFPTWLSFAALALLVVWAVRVFPRHRLFSFGIFWCLVTLSLESSVFPISDVIFEHRLYLPMAGFAVMAAYGIWLAVRTPARFLLVIYLLAAVLGTLTYQRNFFWHDELNFYLDMARRSPNKARIRNNLGNYYVAKGNLAAAVKEYEKALDLDPAFPEALNNLGNIYAETGRREEGKALLERAVAADPRFYEAHYNLGFLLWEQGQEDPRAAWDSFHKALAVNPRFAPAINGLGRICLARRDLDLAKFYFEHAIRVDPSYPHSYENLGSLYMSAGLYDDAKNAYLQAIRRRPSLAVARNNLGNIYAMEGLDDLALQEYQAAVTFSPCWAGAHFNLANLLLKQGDLSGAEQSYRKALECAQKENNLSMIRSLEGKLGGMSPE
ncbi:MAG: tetratricopeptide repeat protein [Candidatus Omnitrophota bacterium]|nr:tetratricopeptide repeat protein [Candidatus Omnitrophota bacterium]MDZ4241467.1 tetratricopeptide repeat protein [Candidatus Omnitrophota bacterium]